LTKAEPIFLDTETVGFYGLPVLIQYAEGGDEPTLFDVARSRVGDTLALIEYLMAHPGGTIAFNMVFDHFHLSKLYTTCLGLDPDVSFDLQLDDAIRAEYEARDRDVFLKPQKTFDLMLHAQKGPYQSMMDRKSIAIRRIPRQLAFRLADELNKRIQFKKIYFARRKEQLANPWQVHLIKDQWGDVDPDFRDIVLQFAPSKALKVLASDALSLDATTFKEISLEDAVYPFELGYAPCAKYIIDWRGEIKDSWAETWEREHRWTWPAVYDYHAAHWGFNKFARQYAANDIVLLRKLYEHFGSPEMDDDDSKLAICVACCRWRGYKVDLPKVIELYKTTSAMAKTAPTSASRAKPYIMDALSDQEKIIFGGSTRKVAIEELATWENICSHCMGDYNGDQICEHCTEGKVPHLAATRAREILKARTAMKQADLYRKTIMAQGRMHASFKVIGAKSSRMSGSDAFNPQGINSVKEVRRCFPLAFDGFELCGGDYDAFEVGIADAVYNDLKLREELQSGRKIHAIFGSFVYPGHTYESIRATEKTENDLYKKSKSGLFAWLYAGTPFTLKHRLGIPEDVAEKGMHAFENAYPQIGIGRQRVLQAFTPLRQPRGIGSKVEWHEPAKFMSTLFGFKRYFDIEFMLCKELYTLANDAPPSWKNVNITVQRDQRNTARMQTASGAVQSALFGAAFSIQSACARAAVNHEIQGTGSGAAKRLQCAIWDHQPHGIHPIIVIPMNIHDEVLAPVRKEGNHIAAIAKTVVETNAELRKTIPLIEMTWERMDTWARLTELPEIEIESEIAV
jgi:hypothetical protein